MILVQNSKGGGLASGFAASQIMGVRKTADFLEKATWVLASSLVVLVLITNFIRPVRTGERQETPEEIKAKQQTSAPALPSAPPPPQNPSPEGGQQPEQPK